MEKATQRKILLSKIDELEYKIKTYDETYSDGDEFFDRQNLEDELFKLQLQLKVVEKD